MTDSTEPVAKGASAALHASDEPAFPVTDCSKTQCHGLSVRDWFAGMAMQGLCANSIPGVHHIPERLLKEAWDIADAMLKARKP